MNKFVCQLYANDVLKLVDVVGEVKNHQSCVLQSDLTDEAIFVVVNANLLLRLRQQHIGGLRETS